MRSLKKGSRIQPDDISVLRTEKILSPGISPEYFSTIEGSILEKEVRSGDGVKWEDFIQR